MIEDIFYLDWKGILPRDGDSIVGYTRYGKNLLDVSASDDFVSVARSYLSSVYQHVKLDCLEYKVLKPFHERFVTDVSWVRAFKADLFPTIGTMKKVDYKTSYTDLEVPIVLKDDGWFTSDKTYLHESIHVVRNNIVEDWNSFEEALAVKFDLIKQHVDTGFWTMYCLRRKIRVAEKKIKEAIGYDEEYVSLRLKEKEMMHVAGTKDLDVKAYLKYLSKGSLRCKIILEKLGL